MKKLFYLSTCSTCQRIIIMLDLPSEVELRDIRHRPISPEEIEQMRALAGSYEALFSRKALKFRSLGLLEQKLTENDYKNWILKEYTFLKRPVLMWEDQIFIGNQKTAVLSAMHAIHGK